MIKYHVQDNSYHLKKDRKIKNGYVTYFEVAEYWLHARPLSAVTQILELVIASTLAMQFQLRITLLVLKERMMHRF